MFFSVVFFLHKCASDVSLRGLNSLLIFPLIMDKLIHQTHTTYVYSTHRKWLSNRNTPRVHTRTHTHTSTLRHWAGTSLKDWKQLKLSSAVALGRPVAARGELPLCISLSVSATRSDMRGRVAALSETHRHCHSSPCNSHTCMLTQGFVIRRP